MNRLPLFVGLWHGSCFCGTGAPQVRARFFAEAKGGVRMKMSVAGKIAGSTLAGGAIIGLGGCAGVGGGATQVKTVWPSTIVHLHASGNAFLVDPATDGVVARLKTEKGASLGATTPDGRKVYLGSEAEGGTTVSVIDLARRDVVAKIRTATDPSIPR